MQLYNNWLIHDDVIIYTATNLAIHDGIWTAHSYVQWQLYTHA